MRFSSIISSPVGDLIAIKRDECLTHLLFADGADAAATEMPQRAKDRFGDVSAQLEEYFAGERHLFELELEPEGTPFQRLVWKELERIPYGQTISYGELARCINKPLAVRAVGGANNRNPISIIIPCHRVVGSGNTLVGYGGGLDRKRTLLALEDAPIARNRQLELRC